MVQVGLKDSSRNFTWGYGMDFVRYPHLILLISGRTFKFTVALKTFENQSAAGSGDHAPHVGAW